MIEKRLQWISVVHFLLRRLQKKSAKASPLETTSAIASIIAAIIALLDWLGLSLNTLEISERGNQLSLVLVYNNKRRRNMENPTKIKLGLLFSVLAIIISIYNLLRWFQMNINLNDKNIMTAVEALKIWGFKWQLR